MALATERQAEVKLTLRKHRVNNPVSVLTAFCNSVLHHTILNRVVVGLSLPLVKMD